MILPFPELVARYELEIDRVLHLGAHLGEERDLYLEIGAREVVWVEADPATSARLAADLDVEGHRVVTALVSEVDGEDVDFFRASNEVSSSMLPMKLHHVAHPEVVVTASITLRTVTVDTLCKRERLNPDLLVLDLQGAELLALRGAPRTLRHVDAVYTEVNSAELYEDCPAVDDLDGFLTDFQRVETVMTPFSWGDALYVHRSRLPAGLDPRAWYSPVKGQVVPASTPR